MLEAFGYEFKDGRIEFNPDDLVGKTVKMVQAFSF
jgi:hypothetical protein